MSKGHILLQNLFPFARGIRKNTSKKMRRTTAILTAGALMFSAFDVFLSGLGGSEREALAAYRQASPGDGEKLEDEQSVSTAGSEEQDWLTVEKTSGDEITAVRQQIGERMEQEDSANQKTKNSYSEDYQVLLNIVQAEAGGCDTTGKILVANVVLNRVKSEKFPDTIRDVVYQKSQFSPVINGTINRVKVSECTRNCVDRALGGEDYSQGALYFMNRRASVSGNANWFDQKLTYLFRHEAHEFFK